MRSINVTNVLYILLCLFFFMMGIVSGQDFVSSDNFNNKIAKDVVVVEFWVEWNNGKEKERFEPNIMFQLEADKKVIQHSVDTITLNKFQ